MSLHHEGSRDPITLRFNALLDGTTTRLEVDQSDSIASVKRKLIEYGAAPDAPLRLVYIGLSLSDQSVVGGYDFTPDALVHILPVATKSYVSSNVGRIYMLYRPSVPPESVALDIGTSNLSREVIQALVDSRDVEVKPLTVDKTLGFDTMDAVLISARASADVVRVQNTHASALAGMPLQGTVVCCPRALVSTTNNRCLKTHTHSSIAMPEELSPHTKSK